MEQLRLFDSLILVFFGVFFSYCENVKFVTRVLCVRAKVDISLI